MNESREWEKLADKYEEIVKLTGLIPTRDFFLQDVKNLEDIAYERGKEQGIYNESMAREKREQHAYEKGLTDALECLPKEKKYLKKTTLNMEVGEIIKDGFNQALSESKSAISKLIENNEV